jgi:hypothetical protein
MISRGVGGLVGAGVLAAVCVGAQGTPMVLKAAEASAHLGEVRTVCGRVMSPKYVPSSRSQPTFLNLDTPYPNQIFTVVIFGSDRPKFGQPEVKYRDRDICATGLLKTYRGIPEIIATTPSQISLSGPIRQNTP